MFIFQGEFQKSIMEKKTIAVIALLICLNLIMAWLKPTAGGLDRIAVMKAYEQLSEISPQEQDAFLESYLTKLIQTEAGNREYLFSSDFISELYLVRLLQKQTEQVNQYGEYLKNIQQQKDRLGISIFQNESEYTLKNMEATIAAFDELNGIEIKFLNPFPFYSITENMFTDLIAVIFLFYLIYIVIIKEKEKEQFLLLTATKHGGLKLISIKILIVALATIILTLLLWGENHLIAFLKYGELDLSAPIQSIPEYFGSALALNIGQYVGIFLLSKIVIYFLIAIIIFFLGLTSRSIVALYIKCFAIFLVFFAVYQIQMVHPVALFFA